MLKKSVIVKGSIIIDVGNSFFEDCVLIMNVMISSVMVLMSEMRKLMWMICDGLRFGFVICNSVGMMWFLLNGKLGSILIMNNS